MPTPRPIIALFTDFGLSDWFVGSMKAVILARAPDCAIVDLCHAVEPGHVAQGAWLLGKTCREFPPGTVFCAVVDPGVGTARRPIVAALDDYLFAAPDNGLLTALLESAGRRECREIANPAWMRPVRSHTFHGRDIFAPAAAQLALGQPIEQAGEIVANPILIELPKSIPAAHAIEGSIIYFDRFGNAITTIERRDADALSASPNIRITAGAFTINRLSSTFADVAHGQAVAYWGSLDTLELALRDANLRARHNPHLGQKVVVESTP